MDTDLDTLSRDQLIEEIKQATGGHPRAPGLERAWPLLAPPAALGPLAREN